MTGRPGPVPVPSAVAGILLLIGAVVGVVLVLQPLVGAGARSPALDAPAEPAAGDRCPLRHLLAPAAPQPVAASDLVECPDSYDGLAVEYTGEVVRAVLRRGDRAWVQVNDDPYAVEIGPLPGHRTAVGGNSGMPVSIPVSAALQIRHVGSYRAHGATVRVSGVFRRADPADAGGPTIQASSVTITRPGRRLSRPADPNRVAVALVLCLAAAGMAALNRCRPPGPWSRAAP